VLFSSEIERLQGIINEKENNNETWRKQSLEIKASYQAQIEDLQIKNTNLKKSLVKYELILKILIYSIGRRK